jgi:hypothetical protein
MVNYKITNLNKSGVFINNKYLKHGESITVDKIDDRLKLFRKLNQISIKEMKSESILVEEVVDKKNKKRNRLIELTDQVDEKSIDELIDLNSKA